MSLWKTHGQEHLTAALDRALREGRLAHAYLLTGPVGVGKATLAMEMAQAVNCVEQERPCGKCQQCQRIQRGIHSDVQFIVPTEDERTGRLIVGSCLDNLIKGAAGQAVQNMNLMRGLPETAGPDHLPVYP